MAARLTVVRGWSDAGDDEREPGFALDGGPEMLTVATEVWQLADPAWAQAIEAVVVRVNARPGGELRFEREDCLDLAALLPGLAARLVADGVVDARTWAVSEAQGHALAARLPALAAASPSPRPGDLVVNGIAVVHDLVLLFERAVAEHAEVGVR